jgi:hypothetical protein
MAITAALETSLNSAADQTSYSIASVSPVDGNLVLVYVQNTSETVPCATPTLSGLSVTWDQVATALNTTSNDRSTLFRAQGTYADGTITVSFGAETQNHCQAHVIDLGGTATGNNGADAIVQSDTEVGASTNGNNCDLASFADATNNACVVMGAVNANDTSFDVDTSSFTALNEVVGGSRRSAIGWRTGEDTTPGLIWSTTSRNYAIIAVEVAILSEDEEEIFTPTGISIPVTQGAFVGASIFAPTGISIPVTSGSMVLALSTTWDPSGIAIPVTQGAFVGASVFTVEGVSIPVTLGDMVLELTATWEPMGVPIAVTPGSFVGASLGELEGIAIPVTQGDFEASSLFTAEGISIPTTLGTFVSEMSGTLEVDGLEIPVTLGTFVGGTDLPDTLPSGHYLLVLGVG